MTSDASQVDFLELEQKGWPSSKLPFCNILVDIVTARILLLFLESLQDWPAQLRVAGTMHATPPPSAIDFPAQYQEN